QLRIPSASFPPYPAIRLSLPQFAVVARFLDRDKLADVYASADICVLPSRTETCGLVALEAMASGLAVVAADAGGFRESIALLKQYASAAVLAGTGAAPFAAQYFAWPALSGRPPSFCPNRPLWPRRRIARPPVRVPW